MGKKKHLTTAAKQKNKIKLLNEEMSALEKYQRSIAEIIKR